MIKGKAVRYTNLFGYTTRSHLANLHPDGPSVSCALAGRVHCQPARDFGLTGRHPRTPVEHADADKCLCCMRCRDTHTIGMPMVCVMSVFVLGRPPPSMRKYQPYGSRLEGRNRVKLGDGCRHVFLDVGANLAVHVRFLMEGRNVFLRESYSSYYWDSTFGPRYADDSTICAFAFEPNPRHTPALQRLASRLRATGRRFEVIAAAASNESGTRTFFNPSNVTNLQQTSFSAFNSSGGYSVTVPTIDLGLFVQEELIGRRVPPPPAWMNETDVRPPSIAMKLDVEGAELIVLERLRALGVLCNFSVITYEYHPQKLLDDGSADPGSYAAHREIYDEIKESISRQKDQKTRQLDSGQWAPHIPRWYQLKRVMDERDQEKAKALGDGHVGRRSAWCTSTRFIQRDYERYDKACTVKPGGWENGTKSA